MKRLFFIFIFNVLFFMVFGDSIIITGNNRANLGNEKERTGLFSVYPLLDKDKVFWIDAGNAIDSNKFTYNDSAKNFWNLYRTLGLSALSLSNHELDFGVDNLKKFTQGIKIISANTDIGDSYIIREIDGLKIGIIGITRPDMRNLLHADVLKDIKLNDLKKSISDTVDNIKDKTDGLILVYSDFFNRKDFSQDILDFMSKLDSIDNIFMFSVSEYEKMNFFQRKFVNGSNLYLIPWGYTHIYRGKVNRGKLEFELEKLPPPDNSLYDFFMKNFKIENNFPIEKPYNFVKSLFSHLRKSSETEFVVINPGTFDFEEDDLTDFLRYDGPLHIVRISGKNIKKLVNHPDYYIYGMEKDNRIFGKIVEDNCLYQVLVNDFTYSQKKNIGIPMYMVKENRINSLRDFAQKNFENMSTEKDFFKILRKSRIQVSANLFKNSLTGANTRYTQVSKLSGAEKEENRIYFRNDLDIFYKKSNLNNIFEIRYSRLDKVTNQKDVKLYTSVTNNHSSLTVYQKIDTSLIKNTNGDIPINYKISFGKKWKELYGGISYQQNFPKNGQDYNLGIQLNYTKERKLRFSRNIKYFADIFYSNNNDKYYEFDANIRYQTPVSRKMKFEISRDFFAVYDDSIGDRAYSSEYFMGISFDFSKSRYFYE